MSTASPPAPSPAAAPAPAFTTPLRILAALAGVLLVALFTPSLLALTVTWDRDPNYSHGYIVLPISLALAYRIARRASPPRSGELTPGLIMILCGVLCQLVVTVIAIPPLSFLAVVAVVRGLLVCAGGREWASKFTFPLLFLFFMFPLPVAWTGYASLLLQDFVSRVSEAVISVFVVCHRVGHTIRIAGVDKSLVVAQECSGIGQIVSFVAFAALLGHLLARPAWYRVTLILAAVPIAVAANTLRVVLMNLGAVWFGTKWMSGALHDTPALFSIPVGVALFLLFDTLLNNIVERRKKPADQPAEPTPTPTPPPAPEPAARPLPIRGLRVACVVLAVGVAAQYGLTAHLRAAGDVSYPQLTGRLDSLPLAIANPATGQPAWVGQDLTEHREATRAKLPFHADDLLYRGYQSAGGAALVYMVHSRIGEDRKHHPEICIRDVSGAPEDVGFRKQVPLAGEGTAQRFRFQTGPGRVSVVYYWHYTVSPTPDAGRTALQNLHLRLGIVAPSVTVQVTVPTDDAATLESVEKLLIPTLDRAARERVLPPGSRAASNRAPIALVRQ